MAHRVNTRNLFNTEHGNTKSIRLYLLTAMNPYESSLEQIKWMRENFNHIPEYKKVIDKIEKAFVKDDDKTGE